MSTEAQTFKGVGTPATRMYGLMAIVALGWVLLGGLIFTPEDAVQGDAVRRAGLAHARRTRDCAAVVATRAGQHAQVLPDDPTCLDQRSACRLR